MKKITKLLLSILLIFNLNLFLFAQEEDEEEQKYFNIFKNVYQRLRQEYYEKKSPKDLFLGAIEGMIKSLDDPHTTLLKPEQKEELWIETKGEYGGLGIVISVQDNKLTVVSPMEDTPAERAGIQSGDVIVKIDGEVLKDPKLEEVVKKLRGEPGTKVTISIQRENFPETIDYTLTREIIKLPAVKFDVINTNIGYIKIVSFSKNAPIELENAIKTLLKKDIKALIVDVRNNPGGLLDVAIRVADEFISEGLIVYTKGRENNFNPFLNQYYYAQKRTTLIPQSLPLVVLINKGSASASEILAGAIQDNRRGLLVGTTTFGKGSVQSVIDLEDGYALRYTTALYFTPSGRQIHKKGIVPDIEVEGFNLSKDDMKIIKKITDGGYIKEFLEKNPQYTEKDIDVLINKLKNNDIEISKNLLMRVIKEEEYKKDPKKRPICNIEFDPQLKMAVQIISLKLSKKTE